MFIELLESDNVASDFVDNCLVAIDNSVDCVATAIRDQIEIQPKDHNSVLTTALKALQLNEIDFSIDAIAVPSTVSEMSDEKIRRIITLDEVAEHATQADCWIVLYDRVYDVTNFLFEHPGGKDVILEYAGWDATIAFSGHSTYALMALKSYEIGELPEKERLYRCPNRIKCGQLPD